MVVAKSERAYSELKRAFRERTVSKRYHALVQATPTRFAARWTPPSAATPAVTAASP